MADVSVNHVELIGRLGKDPEIRTTQAGKTLGGFTLATSESWKDKSGEWQERSEWHRVSVLIDGLADRCGKWLAKGDMVRVAGMLQTRKWTDQQGQDRYTTEVVVKAPEHSVKFLKCVKQDEARASRGSGDSRSSQPARSNGSGWNNNRQSGWSNQASPPPSPPKAGDLDDEIPF